MLKQNPASQSGDILSYLHGLHPTYTEPTPHFSAILRGFSVFGVVGVVFPEISFPKINLVLCTYVRYKVQSFFSESKKLPEPTPITPKSRIVAKIRGFTRCSYGVVMV